MLRGKKCVSLIELGKQIKMPYHLTMSPFVDSGNGSKVVLGKGIPISAVVCLHCLLLGALRGVYGQIHAIPIQIVYTADHVVIARRRAGRIEVLLHAHVDADAAGVLFPQAAKLLLIRLRLRRGHAIGLVIGGV